MFAFSRHYARTVFATQASSATLRARRSPRSGRPDEELAVSEATTTSPDAEEGRRQRLRRQTLRELDAAALDEVREHGAVDLSLRRVARRMGMSPAGLYRYVDSREALLTRLIAGAYHDLADHLEAAIGGEVVRGEDAPTLAVPEVAGSDADVADRLRAAALAYRAWAVAHPQEFGLLFGDPIPNYAAPPGGETVAAMGRVGTALGRPLVEASTSGRLRPVTDAVAADLRDRLGGLTGVTGRELPAEVAVTLLVTWGRLHGQVSLEVFGHHDWLFPDGCEALYRVEVAAILRDLGVVDDRPR
ncbi:TetR/AcrR family transcriptional regulator [Nitriliruptoraceae bacterium ZYF776]|nr:TetR/AcrR family transcriptional regulator [Profundirhabdus halotolerans]